MYLYAKLNWDANFFFPVESKYCMNSASGEYRKISARRGAQFADYLLENLSPEDHENVVD